MAQTPPLAKNDPAPGGVDALLSDLKAGTSAAADAAQAVQQAAQTAQQIAADIQSTKGPVPPTPGPQSRQPTAPENLPLDPDTLPPDLKRLLAIEVPIIVQLGVRRMTVGEVIRLAVGAIIEFHKAADEELELLANNKIVGKGHAVKVSENFGIKLTSIGPIKETIRILGSP